MRLVIISGLSGSGKSVALHVLEDLGFYCIDNIPATLLRSFVDELRLRNDAAFENVGVGLDARNRRRTDIAEIPKLVKELRADGVACEVVFLQTDDKVLLSRFSETRRKHPLTDENTGLDEAIKKERELLGPVIDTAELVIDTTDMTASQLRERVRERVAPRKPGSLSIMIESFGYKHGLPANADFVFDVRCLPNPHYEARLRPLTGLDDEVAAFLEKEPRVGALLQDICRFVETWLPAYGQDNRSSLTVAIGCTGGRHRSVYFAERLGAYFRASFPVLVRHRHLASAT